jgi:hypothetical protein
MLSNLIPGIGQHMELSEYQNYKRQVNFHVL